VEADKLQKLVCSRCSPYARFVKEVRKRWRGKW
jgi:hypothetical protein